MSDNISDHAEDMADSIMNAVASELEVVLSQQSDEVLQVDNKDRMDESANVEVTKESDSSIDNKLAEKNYSSIEHIQDDVADDNEIWHCIDELSPILDLSKNTSEITMEYREESKNDVPTCDEKNAIEMEEHLKDTTNKTLKPETPSEFPSTKIDASLAVTDLCSKMTNFRFTLKIAPTSNNRQSSLLNRRSSSDEYSIRDMVYEYFTKSNSSSETPNSIAANKTIARIKTNVFKQMAKETNSACDKTDSSLRVEEAEDSSGKNESKRFENDDDRTDMRHKQLSELKADCEPIPGSSKDLTSAEKCQAKYCRQQEVHGLQPSCKLSSLIGDLNNRKTSEDSKTDCNRNVSGDRSLEEGFKSTKHEHKVTDPAPKSSVKRNCDSLSDAPSAKHRRRCMSTRNAETGEENKSKHHFRFNSADGKKCIVDKGTGQVGSSTDNLRSIQSRKRKVDKGSKTLIKEFSCNNKRFKKNETSSSEKESSNSNENSD